MSYQRLIQDHDEIDRLARRLERMVESTVPEPGVAAALLMELCEAVRDHLAREDRRIYSRLTTSGFTRPGAPSIEFEAAFQELRGDWLTYLSDWNAELIACDWATFVTETREILARLRARVHQETSLLYPLAMQQGLIRLRASSGVAA